MLRLFLHQRRQEGEGWQIPQETEQQQDHNHPPNQDSLPAAQPLFPRAYVLHRPCAQHRRAYRQKGEYRGIALQRGGKVQTKQRQAKAGNPASGAIPAGERMEGTGDADACDPDEKPIAGACQAKYHRPFQKMKRP